MEQQNDWIFQKAAFAVVIYPAHEYELYSVVIGIKKMCVELWIIRFGTFLCPF